MAVTLDRVAVIGLGLIGGSLALALSQGGVVGEVVGIDRDEETLSIARETGVAHRVTSNLADGVRDADCLVLATPVQVIPVVAREVIPYVKEGAVITDVGSTKSNLVTQMEDIVVPAGRFYVGGHPMVGSEKAGIRAADRYLLENAIYLITRTERTDERALSLVKAMVEGVRARPVCLDPREHDLLVAAVSHLPHLVAVALVETASRLATDHPLTLSLASGGFRDTTRIASGDPTIWRDIFLSNRKQLLNVLETFRQVLDELAVAVSEADACSIEEQLVMAKTVRDKIPARMKGLLPSLSEVVVTVPDRPGVIAGLASVLASQGININDIEILRVREGEGGTIRLGFENETTADSALTLLRQGGIMAKRR